MPPPSQPTGLSRVSRHEAADIFALPKLLLLALLVTTCVRVGVSLYSRRKRRIPAPPLPTEEKESPPIVIPRDGRCPQSKDHAPCPSQTAHVRPAFRSIYPWTAPPHHLPGPYDPRLFPSPTIRRHSYADSLQQPPTDTSTISYTRRVSTNSIPARQSTLHGTITTASNGTSGWRRKQWVVEGG
ncbi:hypothetical protein P154DRAFT_211940 [Amniculicola lignicola CBS 123094]|uniref:Uncharacterized protein n=1 Tax=Amniculicola lignicola CBS 123094 TaxID=1392246 RepID=A0A6A5WEA1_9PLEO|nr:hypothetical protein P154DRAFT_211940 [Amniculicola lignicola CBS 123094]